MAATATSSCPKCGAPRGEAAACPKCGLSTDRMATFTSQLDAGVPDVAKAAWERVKAQWEDTAAHDELLRLATLHGCYAWVAARYRDVRGDGGPPFRETGEAPEPIAERQLARIRRAAEVAMMTAATPRPDKQTKAYQSTKLVLGVVIVLIMVGLLYAMYRNMSAPTAPIQRPSPPPAQVR